MILNFTREAIAKAQGINSALFALALSLVILVRSSPAVLISGKSYLDDWKYTQFFFNYEDEFVKRGLVGEFLRLFKGHVSYELASMFSYICLLFLFCSFYLFVSKPCRMSKGRLGAFLLMIFAAASPATLQHFSYDVGRHDVIIYTVFILLILAINSIAVKSSLATSAIVISGVSFSILVHEAAFFMVLPLSLLLWSYLDSSKKAIFLQIAVFFIMLAITYVVSTRGEYGSLELDAHVEKLRSIYGERVIVSSLNVVHNTSLDENLARTIKGGISIVRLVHHGALALFMFPFLYMLYKLHLSVRSRLTQKTYLLLMASLSPLALYPLGHDHFRWWSLAITNIILIICFLGFKEKSISQAIFSFFEGNIRLVVFIILIGFALGPLGITSSFDVVSYTVKAIKNLM